ncbi:hypothetical protein [Bdellovibrio sp. BCCA]|uniref:hypothetical protein n=1 Tax=Bdellovibrio sp. BCCA TaxID=3136281 RepID=UPI0030F1E38E
MNKSELITIICSKLGVETLQESPLEIRDSFGNHASGPFAEMVKERFISGAMRAFLVYKETERQRAMYRDTQWGHVDLTESEYQQWVSNPSTFRHPSILEAIAKVENPDFWEMTIQLMAAE